MSDDTFNHFDPDGRVHMVDVSGKALTAREAVARATLTMKPETKDKILERRLAKGDVLAVAELAGVMGAKSTSSLIPLCHPVPLSHVSVVTEFGGDQGEDTGVVRLTITATATTTWQTGVEMEALCACTTAALTVYDMCKAVDRGMAIEHVHLVRKTGGKSGTYEASDRHA